LEMSPIICFLRRSRDMADTIAVQAGREGPASRRAFPPEADLRHGGNLSEQRRKCKHADKAPFSVRDSRRRSQLKSHGAGRTQMKHREPVEGSKPKGRILHDHSCNIRVNL
jgi:hypothetical protein